jgi:hypothetical protein
MIRLRGPGERNRTVSNVRPQPYPASASVYNSEVEAREGQHERSATRDSWISFPLFYGQGMGRGVKQYCVAWAEYNVLVGIAHLIRCGFAPEPIISS